MVLPGGNRLGFSNRDGERPDGVTARAFEHGELHLDEWPPAAQNRPSRTASPNSLRAVGIDPSGLRPLRQKG